MVKFYARKKPGMKRAKSGKYYYPAKNKNKKVVKPFRPRRKMRIMRQPFANRTRRMLTYAFRDELAPPNTSQGGFSVASVAYFLNNPYDIDPSVATLSTSARKNHQPMGYDQLMTLYNNKRCDWARIKVNFAINYAQTQINETVTPQGSGVETITGVHTESGLMRVALLLTSDPDIDTSLLVTQPGTVAFEKIVEQAKSGMLPYGNALSYRTVKPGQVVSLTKSINCFKFFKNHENIAYSDWNENNTGTVGQAPINKIYCHIIASPITVTPGAVHPKVTFYGETQFGLTFTELKQLGQS